MNELNNDWVLWAVILSVVFAVITVIGFGWKAFRGMEGLEKDDDQS